IYIGTQSNLGLSGPPALIGATPDAAQAGAAAAVPAVQQLAPPQAPAPAPAPAGVPAPAPQQPTQNPNALAPAPPAPGAAVPGPTSRPAGQIVVSVPGPEFRVGGGPYLVPVSITNASQLSGVTLT